MTDNSSPGGYTVPEQFNELIQSRKNLETFWEIPTRLLYGQGLCQKCGQNANYYPSGKALRPHKAKDGQMCRHRKFVKPAGILPKTLLGFPVIEIDDPRMKDIVIFAGTDFAEFDDWSRWAAIKNIGASKKGGGQ